MVGGFMKINIIENKEVEVEIGLPIFLRNGYDDYCAIYSEDRMKLALSGLISISSYAPTVASKLRNISEYTQISEEEFNFAFDKILKGIINF